MNETQQERFSDALIRLAGDDGTFKMLASMACEDVPLLLSKIGEACQSGDVDTVAKESHSLKGLLSTFEVGEPVSELQPMIDAARSGDTVTAQSHFQKLERPVRQLIAEIAAAADDSKA